FIAIFTFIHIIFPFTTHAAATYPEGTMVEPYLVEDETTEQSVTSVETEIAIWQNGDNIALKSNLETFHLPRTAFEFDVPSSINELNEQTNRTWSTFFMRPKDVHVPLIVHMDEENEVVQELRSYSYIDADATFAAATSIASELGEGELPLIYIDEDNVPFQTMEELDITIPDELSDAVMTYAVKELNDQLISSNELFSVLDAITFPGNLNHSNIEMSFIGSSLYELFLHTDVQFIERNIPITVPSYGKSGLVVEVNRNKEKDFTVFNASEFPLKIVAEKNEDVLTLSIQSTKIEKTYGYEVTQIEEIEPRTLYRYNNLLNPGESNVFESGQNGEKVFVERLTYEHDNMLTNRENISEVIYVPEPRIVEISPYKLEEVELETPEQTEATGSFEEDMVGIDDMISDNVAQQSEEMEQVVDQID